MHANHQPKSITPAGNSNHDNQSASSSSSSSSSTSAQAEDNNDVKSTALVVYQDFEEVTPTTWNGMYFEIKRIIWDFSFDPRWLMKSFGFFHSSFEQEILALAYYAAPLEQVEAYIRKAHAKKESHLSATLVLATIQAIMNLDVTILDAKGEVITEGMANRLMKLHEELLPATFPQSLKQIRLAIPLEDENEKCAREDANVAAVTEVFEALKYNDEKTDPAIEKFVAFAKNSTQLNRLHLLYVAFDALTRRGEELPTSKTNDPGGWAGALADRFCYEIIGAAIEKDFSPRMRKILEVGVFYILNRKKEAVRKLDIDGEDFAGTPGAERELGVNSYYDVFWKKQTRGGGLAYRSFFKTCYDQLYHRCELLLQSDTQLKSSAITYKKS